MSDSTSLPSIPPDISNLCVASFYIAVHIYFISKSQDNPHGEPGSSYHIFSNN